MEAEIFKVLSAGGDLSTIAIVVFLFKLDKRVLKLEWGSENEKTQCK